MGVQRATVLHWLFENKVVSGRDLKCDRGALNAAIGAEQARRKSRNEDGTPGNKRGRPGDLSEIIIFLMLAALRSGELDEKTLSDTTGKSLEETYGASINTCFAARKVALAEWHRQRGATLSKIPNK